MSGLIKLNEVQLFLCFRHLGEVKWKCSCCVVRAHARVCMCVCWRKLVCGVQRRVRKTGCQLVSSRDAVHIEKLVCKSQFSFELLQYGKSDGLKLRWRSCSLPISAPDVSYCWTKIMAITTTGQRL